MRKSWSIRIKPDTCDQTNTACGSNGFFCAMSSRPSPRIINQVIRKRDHLTMDVAVNEHIEPDHTVKLGESYCHRGMNCFMGA